MWVKTERSFSCSFMSFPFHVRFKPPRPHVQHQHGQRNGGADQTPAAEAASDDACIHASQRTASTSAVKTYPAPRSVRINGVGVALGSILRRRRPTCTSIERS